MKYTRGQKQDGKIVVEFSLDAKEWEKEVENAYNKTKGRYNIDGFRKGKVPRSVLEKTFGEYLFYEDAFNDCFPKYYTQVLKKEKELTPVDYPEVNVVDMSECENGVYFFNIVNYNKEISIQQVIVNK